MNKLFTKGNIGNMELKNRWIMLAIHTGFSENGYFSSRDIEFYRRRAKGGMAAITLVGCVGKAGESNNMNMLDDDRYDDKIRETVDAIHEGDCKVIMQLYHAGRNNTSAVNGIRPIAPSPVPSPIYKEVPKEMDENDIEETLRQFVSAALRCKRLGVDCIEVSISAGYLLSEFLSPLTNKRNDQWGGDETRRMKYPSEVLKAIREAVGSDYPVIIKISGGDMLGGYDCDYMARFINQLPEGTIDGVTVTGGWHEAPIPQITYHVRPGQYAYLAHEIKKKTGMKVIACNRINNPETAEKLLDEGACDFTGAARAFLADPDFALKSEAGKPYNVCQGCNRCLERTLKKKEVQCAFNSVAGREYLICDSDDSIHKRVLIAGAGPAGLEAAYLCVKRGFDVTVIYEDNRPGGKLEAASKPPYKHDFIKYVENKEYELRNVRFMPETVLTEELIEETKPDAVIIAIGSYPYIPKIEGLDPEKSVSAEDILMGKSELKGDSVVIIGGGSVGLETAEFIASNSDKKITVVEKLSKSGKGLGGSRWITQNHLRDLGVNIICDSDPIKYENQKLIIKKECVIQYIDADLIVFAIGYKPNKSENITNYLTEKGISYKLIGDCNGGKTIMDATREAFEAVYDI